MGFSRASSTSKSSQEKAVMREKEDGTVVQSGVDARIDEEARVNEIEVDGVFGAQGDGTVNYRSVGWISTSILLMKTQIGLGVLNIPEVFHTLGLAPGVIILVVIAVLTTWTDYYIGIFKVKHPTVYSVSDCGALMFGRVGREIFGVGYWLLMTCIVGSALLGLSTALNAISLHATCTAVFVVVAAVATYPLASLRTLGGIKWVGWVGLASMIVSIITVTVAVGAGGRPSLAPKEGPMDLNIVIWGHPTFADAMNAIGNLVFAYAGTAAFLPIACEMRNTRDYGKAVITCQTFVTVFYIVIGVVVYCYAGQYVASPALGTAGVLLKRISYGLALPGLLAAAVIYTHLPAKWLFVRFLRNSHHLTHSTPTHWIVWLSCTLGCLLFSYIIASAIPVFGGLVGLVGALFGTMFSLQAVSVMWFFDYWPRLKMAEKRTKTFWFLVAMNAFIIVGGTFIMVGGTYGSVISIRDSYKASGGTPWSKPASSGPLATGKASLLFDFSSSPAVKADEETPATSSPVRTGMGQSPARAERGGEAGPSGSGGKGDGKGKAPLRGTQSLSSIEKGIQKVDRPTAGLSRAARAASASLAFSLDSSLAAPSTSNAMRRPPTRMTPAVEEGENTARSPVMMPSSIDLTASPSDKSASLSKVQKEMGATIEISDSESEGRRRVGLLAGASASPQKRSRGSARIRKYKMMRDELGRDVMDLTVSSPSASSSVLDDSDDSEIVVVTRPRHSSRASSATPKAGPSGTQSLRVKREPTASVSPAKSSSLASPSRRAAPLASSLKENNGAFSPRKKIAEELMPPPVSPMRKSAPSTPKKATDALPAMPRPLCSGSKSLPNVSEGEQGDWIASSSPRRTATPAVSVTSASSSSPSKRARSDGSSSRGLPDSPNLRLLRSSPRPEMCSNPSDSSRSTITASQPLTPRRGSASAFNSLAQANTDANAEAGPSNLTSPALRRLTDFDKRDTRRAPGGGPSYVREPTGSPLSSLAPTPKKPLSRAATWTSGSTAKPRPSREHNFELIIETKPVPGSRTASLKKFTPVATGKGKGKAAAAPNFKKNEVRKARDGLTSEWDAFMQDASSDEGSDDESDDREGSPSPAKSRKPPRRSRNDASDSDSGSSSSSSDESAAESDDDELADFLNRAKARREAGETLASTIDTSPSAATAPSTVSPDRVIDDPRRSSRAKRETNHYSPSKAAKPPASSLATSTAKAKKATESLGLMDQTTKRSVLQFDRIMKDRAAREKKGHTDEWYAKWKTELGRNDGPESDDDFDTGSDTSMTSDLEASSALGRVKPLDTSVVTSALATDSDEDLPAPGALAGATQKKAALIENLLSEETEQEKKEREAAVESKQQLDLRTFWRPSEMCSIDELDREEYVGDGWRGQIAQALRDIFAPPMRFPSAVTLFSPLSSGGIGSQEDHQVVSRWLVQLLCFPGETFAGEHLVDLLARIASYTARMSRDRESTSSLVDAKYLASMLVKLGAKPRAVEVPQEMVSIASESEASDEAEDTFAEPSRKAQMLFSAEQRWPAVRQWCKVVQVLCLHGRVLSDNDASRLAVLCVRLAIDPQSASMRSTFVWTIQCLLATMPSGSAARSNTFRHLVNLCRPTRHRTQVAVLQTIPHDSQANKLLREWLAWSFVATDSSVADVLVRPSLLGSVLPSVLELLVSPPRESPLRPLALTGKPPFADLDLVEQVKLLTISLTSLADPLVASDLRIEHRKTLERIIRRIETIDSRLRADARKGLQVERLHAKNLLTGLKYSLTYQLMNARGEKSAFGLSEEEEKAIKRKETAHGNEAKRQRLEREDDEAAGRKQSTLDFFRKPAVKRAALARPRQEKAMDVDSEEEVADGLLRT
ncbi:amino acid transporter [Rhodotorula toruloides]|uniref:Amino acid transporter n=1 Tax=Rhodotorula toruloides TaxID=5286 RepID=A0A511KC78_RHOTO|nr:amino acid transporter [Rhodotorula toruloides]